MGFFGVFFLRACLTFKAPITAAADDILKKIFVSFQRKQVDISRRIT